MPGERPVFQHLRFTVWPNRVEVVQGFWIFKKTVVLPIRKISTVKAHDLREVIEIATDDGTTHMFSVQNPSKARDAIVNLL